ITVLDHKFPVSVTGVPGAVGGISWKMPFEQAKVMSRRLLEMWNSGSSDNPETVLDKTYINHQESDVAGGVRARNLEQWKELLDEFRKAFSKADIKVTMQVAEGDRVASRWEMTAIHTGEFMGAAPTNKRLTWTGIAIDRFENGKIAETWMDWDKYRFFEGIGLTR
ncbi:MAG TPA: ester cyclase, partial [Terriglobia bacterium]|nr:ester cyclase [Terriglobia bacterium]